MNQLLSNKTCFFKDTRIKAHRSTKLQTRGRTELQFQSRSISGARLSILGCQQGTYGVFKFFDLLESASNLIASVSRRVEGKQGLLVKQGCLVWTQWAYITKGTRGTCQWRRAGAAEGGDLEDRSNCNSIAGKMIVRQAASGAICSA